MCSVKWNVYPNLIAPDLSNKTHTTPSGNSINSISVAVRISAECDFAARKGTRSSSGLASARGQVNQKMTERRTDTEQLGRLTVEDEIGFAGLGTLDKSRLVALDGYKR